MAYTLIFSVMGCWEGREGARSGGVKAMCARDARWGGLRASLRPGVTEDGLHSAHGQACFLAWSSTITSLLQFQEIQQVPATAIPWDPTQTHHLSSAPEADDVWRKSQFTTSFCWAWEAEGEFAGLVDSGQLSEGTYSQVSLTTPFIFFFLFKETLFEFHFSICRLAGLESQLCCLLTVRPQAKSYDLAKPQILHL